MPTVDVPSVGLVEFPDSMDQDAISGAIRSHFEKARTAGVNATIRGGLLPLQILTAPGVAEASEMGQAQGRIRRLLNTPPEMPPSTGEQRAASDLLLRPTDDEAYLRLINTPRAMRIAGIRRAIEEKTPDEITPSPEALQAAENETSRWINPPKAVAQTALGALSEAQQAVGLPSYNVDKLVLPPGMGKNIVNAAGELIMPSAPGGSNLGPAGKGISEAASDLIQNLTPADAVAMATGPVGGAGYALEMAHGAPDQAAELGKAIGDKDPVAASKAAVNLAMGVAAPAGLVHGMARLASPRSVPIPDFPGQRLPTPRGAAPEATAAEVLRASPEEAAAQAEQMNRDAQAAAAIEKPKGPAGVQNPPTILPRPEVPVVGPSIEEQRAADALRGPAPEPQQPAGWDDFVSALKARGQGNETIAQIQAMFPDVPMNREAARRLGREAFGEQWRPPQQAKAKAPEPEPAAVSDYDRYNELVKGMAGKSLDEMQAAAKEIEQIKNRNGGMPPKAPAASTDAIEITPDMAGARAVLKMTPDQFHKSAQSFNKVNLDIGRNASPEEVIELQNMAEEAKQRFTEAVTRATASGSEADLQAVADLGNMRQFFSEAVREAKERPAPPKAVTEAVKPPEDPPTAPASTPAVFDSKPPQSESAPQESTTAIDPNAVQTIEIPLSKLKLSKDVPNFKSGASETTGVVTGQELEGKYERHGTAPIVVWQRLNGDLEVITGRHRFDLARRTGEKTIPGQIVRESDGFTKDQAITFDAEANIRDGQGEVSDYATYFKGTEISEPEARARGLLSRAKGKAGWVLAKNATDDLYTSWRAGHVTDAQAVAIAESAPGNSGAQRAGIKLAQSGKSADIISAVLRRASQAEGSGKAENLDLFGADDTAIRQMEADEAKASTIRKGIKGQIAAVQGAAKRPEAAAKLGVNVKDPEGVIKRVNQLKGELDRWSNWWLHPDLSEQVRPTEPKPQPKPSTPKPPGKSSTELFGSQDTPFNLTGETQAARQNPTVTPKVDLTGFGNETLAQHELFSIEKVVESKDPTKSADAAQKLYGGAREAAIKLKQQLDTIDADPKTAKTFTKPQRQMLDNVIALLREREAKEPSKLSEQATAYLDKAAEEALKRIQSRGGTTFGSGPLHELPNIKDYAIYGAAKLAKLGVRSAEWANEMRKAFGKRIEPHLDKIYDAAKQYLEDYRNQTGSAGKLSSVQQIIAAHTGAEPVRLNGVTGAIDALQSSLRTVRALKEHFEGQPKVSKAEVKVADDFLEADANKIRESLTELVKNELPVSERGRFITAINNATKRVPILTGDPAAMYRQAARVAARIEERSQEVRKGAAIADLQKTVRSALNSPSVDLGYKNRILELMRRVSFTKPTAETLASLKATREYLDRMDAQGKETQIPREILDQLDLLTKIPLRDMPSEAVHALADKINQLEQLGRLKIESRQRVWDAEKASKLDQLSKENTIPFEKRAQVGSALKSERTTKEDFANALNKRLAGGELLDRAILPIDAGLELLQGGDPYRGWLFRNVRGPLDLAYNAYQVLRDNLAAEVEALVKKHKMGEAQAERINLYGIAMMEKGAHLPRLLAQGFTDEQISNVLRTITPEERAVYSAMRKAFDASLPDLQKTMHELYNIDVKPVEDYWPLPREWELTEVDPKDAKQPKFGKKMDFDELAGWQELLKDFRPKTTKTERGMTIERKPQAQTPVQTNAFEVFYRHINDVSYLLKHQRDLKLIGEMVRTDTFKQKYGSLGQTSVIDWLDTVAKQGRLGGLTRWNWLDSLRRRTSAGVISWRLGSQFVHLSSLPLSLKRTGFENYGRALAAVFTDKGQQFMKDNFAETFARGGGEPALIEAAHLGENPLIKQGAYRTAVRWGFSGARAIDRYNSQATALGVYMKELERKGLDPSKYSDLPVDKEAQAYALVQARRAVASPLSKDVSPSLARGAMFGNNVSVARSIQQFQNVFQDQWSNIRVDLWKNGIKARNPKEAAAMVIALTAMIVAETGIREGAKEVIKGVSGSNPKKKEDVGGKVAQEVLRRFPFGGQMTSWALYGESGIPTLDSLVSEGKNLHSAFTAKNPRTQDKALIRAIGGAAQISGVPGSSQGAELIEKSIK